MYILGIDTSTQILDVAVTKDGIVLASGTSDDQRTHSERAMPMVEKVLEDAGLKPDDIDIFACCTGPGSYTGVRIGVAIAKGLARGAGKQVRGISSFDLMEKNDGEIAVIDARNDAVFTRMGRVMRSDLPENAKIVEPFAGKWAGIMESDLGGTQIIYLGGSV